MILPTGLEAIDYRVEHAIRDKRTGLILLCANDQEARLQEAVNPDTEAVQRLVWNMRVITGGPLYDMLRKL